MNVQSSSEPGPIQTDATPAVETEMRLRYSAVRSSVAEGAPIAVLHIGADRTAVATGSSAEPTVILAFDIGSQRTAADFFKHNPPTPGEMENAITAVEDALMPLRPRIEGSSTLLTTDAAVREIALVAGLPDQPESILTRDAMERTFQRLAAVTLGRPASREGLPASAAFAATLLILREFMHHMGFPSITLKG